MISFMNTFFVASILICCLLVLMLIYNFRQRLSTLETNYKLALEMMNNVVQKMELIENNVASGGEVQHSQELNIPMVPQQQYNVLEQQDDDDEDGECEQLSDDDDEDENGSDEEGDDDDDEDENGSDDDDDDDDDEDENGSDDDDDEEDENVAESKENNVVEQQEDMDDDNTISTEDGKEMARTLETDGEMDYEKMNLTQLRALVKTRGLSSSVSKMKKADALALLTA